MRILELGQELIRQVEAAGGLQYVALEPPHAPALPPSLTPPPAPTAGDELYWRPTPSATGALVQDPDFTLPTTAGPLRWSLYHDSESPAEGGPWGYGRRASFPLNLRSDGATVTVMHEDGTRRQYRKDAGSGTFYALGGNYDYLALNGDGTWDETLWESGLKYHYPAGTLVSVAYRETPHGLRLTYGYDPEGRLERVEEPAGRRVTLGYAASGLTTVQYVQDWGDRRNTLTYDAAGDLVEEEGPTGCLTQYEYNGDHRLTGITDPEGYETTYTYDYAGRVLSRSLAGALGRYTYQVDANNVLTMTYEDPLGRIWTHTTSGRENPLWRIDPLGNRETYQYLNYRLFNSINALGELTSYAYDGNGFLRGMKDALGNRWTYVRDGYGNLTVEENPLGHRTSYSYGANPALRQPVTVMNALGFITTYGYTGWGAPASVEDPLGHRTTSIWSSLGLLEEIENALGQRRTYSYDLVGNRTVEVDPLGYRWTSGYDAMGRQTTMQNPRRYVRTTVYDARGLVIAQTNTRRVWSYSYNAAGSRTGEENPLGNRTTWHYDAANQLVAQENPLRQRTSYSYDLAGRQEATEDPRGYRSTTVYNAAGQAVAQVDPLGYRTSFFYDGAGRQQATQDALGHRHSTLYDAAGRVHASEDPLGYRSTSVYSAAGQLLGTEDALGRRTTTVYDAAGRSVAQQDARGYFTTFLYDAAGQQVGLQNANGGIWTTRYDARGSVVGEQDPLGVWTTYVYDEVGNRERRLDGRGVRTTYIYLPEDQLQYVRYPDGSRLTYVYDLADQNTEVWDAGGRHLYTYDRAGQLFWIRHFAQEWRQTYGYDPAGNRLWMDAPSTGRTTYSYDGRNQVTGIVNPWGEVTTFEYDALGRELRKTLANGMTASHLYDAAGRELVLENRKADGEALAVYTATYDAVGNRLTVQELDDTRVTYRYDASYQLVYEARDGAYAYTSTYVYDGNGNRLEKQEGIAGDLTEYSYNLADELLLVEPPTGPSTAFLWDANGNQAEENTGGDRTTYTWDPENRLGRITRPNGSVQTNLYTPTDLRIRREDSNGLASFIWDEAVLLQERDQNGQWVAEYLDYPGHLGGLSSMTFRLQPSVFPGFDLNNDTRLITDMGSILVATRTFDAFGNVLGNTGSATPLYGFKGKLRYYEDSPPRLYVGARYLQTHTGRWLSRDPMREGTGFYTYVLNNPVAYADPTGLFVQAAACIGLCALGGGFIGLSYAGCKAGGTNSPCETAACMFDTYMSLSGWRQTALAAGFMGCVACLSPGLGSRLAACVKDPKCGGCILGAGQTLSQSIYDDCKTGTPAGAIKYVCKAASSCLTGSGVLTLAWGKALAGLLVYVGCDQCLSRLPFVL